MPIVDIEMVTRPGPADMVSEDRLGKLADALGEVFRSPPAGTWVRLRYLPESCYAENRQVQALHPVFVTVLKAQLPSREDLAEEARAVTAAVAAAVSRPEENVHVLYQPAAAGRIAFGSSLRTE